MKISVTQEHIDNGVAGNCYHCPVAQAIHEALPCSSVAVNRVNIHANAYVNGFPEPLVIPTPEAAGIFMRAFDALREVSPFEFDLPIELLMAEMAEMAESEATNGN